MAEISKVLSSFPFQGEFVKTNPINEGLINTTLLAEYTKGKYIVQKINIAVFTKPDELMKNILDVTEYLKTSIIANGGDPDKQTLHFLKTNDGNLYYIDEDGSYWRSYAYQDNTYTLNSNCSLEEKYEAAKAFGEFQYLLKDFPGNRLYETIENFHYTPSRFDNLKKAIEADKAGRVKDVQEEISFFLEREKNVSVVTDLIKTGDIPVRVTHNDTKINNVLFDCESKKSVCVIDLDTIMPGSLLYDFGDGIRTGATDGEEDDPEKIGLNLDAYEAYTKGYLDGAKGGLTQKEIELLPFSVILLTQEVAMRFLTDYLDGDVYFKTSFEGHNLVRTRAQIKLIKDIEAKFDKMKEITLNASK